MFVSYPGRSLHLLKVCLALLVIYAGFSYWRITSGYTDSGNPWTRPPPLEGGNKPPSPPAPLHNGGNSAPAPAAAEVDEDSYRGAAQTVDNKAAPPPPPPPPPSQPLTATDDLTSDDQIPLSLSLPAEYNSHPPTSSFCASRFTPQWFDIVRDNHQQYCLDSSASRLHCFHTPSDFHNDRHIDTFCIGQNVVYDSKREKFTLDCAVTKQVTPGLPQTPLQFHEYWYSTGPRPIFSEWVTLDDRAGLIREMKVKGPVRVNSVANEAKGGLSTATASSSSSSQGLSKPKALHEPDQPGRPTERDIDTDTARKPQYRPRAAAPVPPPQRQDPALPTSSTQQTPRTFTVLLKREGSHNIFHSLHELMSLMQTFDALRTTRDAATGQPYFVSPQDVENTQIVVLDEHPDGPYFDLWKLFSGRQPKRITEMAGLDVGKPVPRRRRRRRDVAGTLSASAASEDSRGGESMTVIQEENQDRTWLTKPLDNLIVPLAGAANSVWHDDWEKWDCVNELRTVFVRRVLDFYGFPADEPVARLGSVPNTWGKKRDVDGDGSSDEDATSQATGDSQETTIEKSTNGKSKTGGQSPKSGGQKLKTLSGSSTGSANIESAEPASSIQPPATSDEDVNSNTESTGDSPTPYNNEQSSTPIDTAIAPPKSATKDPESLSPWRPGALRITFIDRKETRRVQDTAALLTHARTTLARSKLDVHIRAIDFATLSFREQIALARQTDILVGVHGAGLTHTLFMKQDMGALIEIFPEGFELRCFRAMARDRGLEYYKMHVPVVEKKEDFHGEDVIVPRDKFVEVLEHAVKALDNRPGSFRDFY